MYSFRLFNITDISVGEPVHGKYIVDGMNDRDKQMPKL